VPPAVVRLGRGRLPARNRFGRAGCSVRRCARDHYYVSHRLIAKGTDPTGCRLPGRKLESIFAGMIADHLGRADAQHHLLAVPDLRADPDLGRAARTLAAYLLKRDPALLTKVLISGILEPGTLKLTLDRPVLSAALGVPADYLAPDFDQVTAELQLRRRGVEAKLIVGDRVSPPDPELLRTLPDAHRWTQLHHDGIPLGDIAIKAGHH
jgi:site-specific DNA recombinase